MPGEVKKRKEKNPDDVDEVPVKAGKFHRKISRWWMPILVSNWSEPPKIALG